ncbi:uncharacterized protein LOC133186438 [Saccostrea echinata]|uniref:uncharacterized protein LOC133186438 n=1 Tax=Saccostrea echinata TaxID=191078 RepID=UPI002A810FE7|nr:uncharacterized protein LOC133186438 [Saccostrea echinata]
MAVPSQANVDDVMLLAKDILDMVEPSLKEKSEAERKEIDDIMRKCVSKEIQLTNALGDISEMPDEEVFGKMKTLLSDDDFKMISGYVDQETYTMDIKGSEATVQRGGQKFLESVQLTSLASITDSSTVQIVSLVVECVLFVVGCIGIKVHIKESVLRKIITEVMPAMKQPAFQRIINTFLRSWKNGSALDKAKAIFNLVKETNSLGIFWKIIKMAFKEMRWWEYARAIAEITALIIAAFATGGAALVAKIALSVSDAVNITRKVINLAQLQDMAKAF